MNIYVNGGVCGVQDEKIAGYYLLSNKLQINVQ